MRTLSEIAKEKAKKQPKEIDQILEETPVLARLRFSESTHDMHNVAEIVTEVDAADWVPMNGVLPQLNAASRLTKVDLAIMGGEIEVPEDTAIQFGGKDAYFAKKLPKIRKRTGMQTEQNIIYGNWYNYCRDNGRYVSADTSANNGYTLFAVRLVDGEHNGLYSPKGFGQGTMLNVLPLSGGSLYKSQSDQYKGVNVYGIRLKAYIGWQILNSDTVAMITGISAGKPPTKAMIDDMLTEVRATDSGTTMLVCHQKCKDILNSFKDSPLRMVPGDKAMDTRIDTWNGIPIITTYNMTKGQDPNLKTGGWTA